MSGENFAQKLMRATGKLLYFYGPANRSSATHEMTEDNKRLLVQRQAEAQQFETITRPDGSTYVVPKNPDDQSLR
ncbi:hypothetical protein SCMU_05520 [Sinomonas cyclohexanicum]|uniref:Uncharacterized protein n=1 Tax=Sinomonas cyclohexanicum TaxID=322009 RepID=A0ABM7PR87_SINCY|nr:hypothetical protein [Corynebacterium cyclohexanicum]BCT74710.1 hypothetical protein SCMU_05520 [Corynebacterium cyclohexanicum]